MVTRFNFRLLETGDAEWDDAWERLPEPFRDVFYSRSYAELHQQHLATQHRVRAAVAYQGNHVILYPFVLRTLIDLRGLSCVDARMHDIRGLYGRSGPVGAIRNSRFMQRFLATMSDYLADEGVISSFDRLHPLLHHDLNFEEPFEKDHTGQEVIVNLRLDDGVLWRSFRPSVRKNSRKAYSGGVRCLRREGEAAWSEFMYLDFAAMRQKEAASFYHFNTGYFEAFRQILPSNHSVYLADVNGQVVSAELVLHSGQYAHSFLGATDPNWRHVQPNSLLKTFIITDLRDRGFSTYLLGGGLAGDDSVFSYKKSFAPLGVVPSSILLGLFDKGALEALRVTLESTNLPSAPGRFQFYDLD